MKLFNFVPEKFFNLLTGSNRQKYLDCLSIIFDISSHERAYSVDREMVVNRLENYFEENSFDANDEAAAELTENSKDARAKANAVIRLFKAYGWVEEEQGANMTYRLSLPDYSITILESIKQIVSTQEDEFQSMLSPIYTTLKNKEMYKKPYEFVIKNVIDGTDKLIRGLKRLNTNIKKYIDNLTLNKSLKEVIEDLFKYDEHIASQAYNRLKTSDNISFFRPEIISDLKAILNDGELIQKASKAFCEIEKFEDEDNAATELKFRLLQTIDKYKWIDEIINDIDNKNAKYQKSAVERARFLLASGENYQSRINLVLKHISDKFNQDDDDGLEHFLNINNLIKTQWLTDESLYTPPVYKESGEVEEIATLSLSEEMKKQQLDILKEKTLFDFTRSNINKFVENKLADNDRFLASNLDLGSKKDFIRLIFIFLYGIGGKVNYRINKRQEVISLGEYKFTDFEIERSFI